VAKNCSGRGRPPKLMWRDGKHRPLSVKELALRLPKRAWRTINRAKPFLPSNRKGPSAGRSLRISIRPPAATRSDRTDAYSLTASVRWRMMRQQDGAQSPRGVTAAGRGAEQDALAAEGASAPSLVTLANSQKISA
jgi:hypothetical protein